VTRNLNPSASETGGSAFLRKSSLELTAQIAAFDPSHLVNREREVNFLEVFWRKEPDLSIDGGCDITLSGVVVDSKQVVRLVYQGVN
jgi:hypothetical protein